MRYALLVMVLISASWLSALVINHIPPSSFETDMTTEVRIEVIQGIAYISEAYLMYREHKSGEFISARMELESKESLWWRGYLPVTASPSSPYEYYFRFQLIDGSLETLPVFEPERNAYLLQPRIKPGDLTKDFILVSTEGTVRSGDGLVIAVSWFALEEAIDVQTVNLYLNGKNVTPRAYVGSSMLLYRDSSPKAGVYTYFLSAKTKDGQDFHSNTWSTVVISSGGMFNLPMNLQGTFRTGTSVYATANESPNTFGRDKDDGWANLELLGYHKNLQLQAYSHLSTRQNENSQHVNRFKLGVLFPFWSTYIGDYSPYLTHFTMSNRNVRGLFTKLHSRNAGISFTHGEMVRGIDGRQVIDPETKETTYTAGTFKQEAIAARIQLGPDNGLYFGITTARNRDIVSSLDSIYVFKAGQTEPIQQAFPKDNLVLSMDARLTLPKQNIIIGVEGAGSLYNSNTYNGAISQSGLEEYLDTDIPFNPAAYEDIFIINTNMNPLPMSSDFRDPSSFLAWQAYLRNVFMNNMLNVNVTQVGSSFRSLSSSNAQRDVTQWSVFDQYTFRQYLFLGGGISRNKDNLSKSKIETNVFDNYYVQAMLRLPRYPYLLASYTNSNSKNEPNSQIVVSDDALYNPYKRKSNVLSFTLGREFTELPVAVNNVDVGWRIGRDYAKTRDFSKALVKQYDYNTDNVSLSVSSRFVDIPLRTQVSVSYGTQENTVPDTGNNNLSFLMRGEYGLLKNRLKPWAEYRITSLSGDQDAQAYNYINLGLEARPLDTTSITTTLGWQIYNNDDKDNVDYTTTSWHLVITQRF